MFTGIVEAMGTLVERCGSRFTFESTVATEDARVGDSIAVNGVCLTVVDLDADSWSVDAVDETLLRSTLGSLSHGDSVNVERSVRAQDRLGGHIVQGHVDCTGTVVSPAPDLRVRVPPQYCRYIVDKGSITVDGVSLTVVDAYDDGFSIAIIPHTAEVTTIGALRSGDQVNIEVDALARYAERIVAYATGNAVPKGSVDAS